MFQNINARTDDTIIDDSDLDQEENKKKVIKAIVSKQNIILYIISFMISTVGIGTDITPFAIAILASCLSCNIPIGVVLIVTCIGTWIGFGGQAFLWYFLMSLILMGIILFIRPKIDEINERKKITLHLGIACTTIQVCKLLVGTFLIYDLLQSILFVIFACVFYKIFSGSIQVIREFDIKKAFSIEEVIGASLMIAIAITGFKDIAIFGYSVKNILSILLVLILGWQNGILVGAASGLTIGAVLGIICSGDPIQVAAYGISGMLAGLLNRLGKVGVIAGFLIGNGILIYVAKADNSSIILIQEILIASIGLLAVPKNIKINIEDLIDKTQYLPVMPEKRLEQNEETIYKLNHVSEAISEVADSYKEVAATVLEEEDLQKEKCQQAFLKELHNQMQEKEDNLLFDEVMEDESSLLDDIFNFMIQHEIIQKNNVVEIFAKNNSYIIASDDDKISNKLEQDIDQVVKSINYAYRVSKIHFICNKKIDENRKVMGDQLHDISKMITSIAEDINQEKEKREEKEEQEIKDLLQKKGILVDYIRVKKQRNGRKEISIYMQPCQSNQMQECNGDKIKKYLTKFYQEEMILVKEECPLNKNTDRCFFKYMNKDIYSMKIGIAKTTKKDSEISGDSTLKVKLEDGKYLIAISDGMGSGVEARKSSKVATKMLKRLLISGFDKETSIDLINSSMCLNASEDSYATLDIAILDLYKGNVEFIKNGACPTFIKKRKKVDVIKTMSLPTGIVGKIDLNVYDRDIDTDEFLIMCSDGILESNEQYENKELWLKFLLEDIETTDAQKIANIILNEAIDNNFGLAKDDMTVLVLKLEKNN